MGEETARLRQEIEQTREDLTRDVDRLAEKTSPSRIVERRVRRTRDRLSGLKEKIMGSDERSYGGSGGVASSTKDTARGAAESAKETLVGAKDQVTHAGERAQEAAHDAVTGVRERTEGNPLAAGVVAFGIGWLVSSLLPASDAETHAAQRAGEVAQEHGGPVLEEAKQAAQEVGQELSGHAKEAAQQVKERAQEAAQTVREEATSSSGSR